MKLARKLVTTISALLLLTTLCMPAAFADSAVDKAFDTLKTQYATEIGQFISKGVDEATLKSLLGALLNELNNDSTVTASNFNAKLIESAAIVGGDNENLQDALVSIVGEDKLLASLLTETVPSELLPIRNVIYTAWIESKQPQPNPGGGVVVPPATVSDLYEIKLAQDGTYEIMWDSGKVLQAWSIQASTTPLELNLDATTGPIHLNLPQDVLAKGKELKKSLRITVAGVGSSMIAFANVPSQELSLTFQAVDDSQVVTPLGKNNLHAVSQAYEWKSNLALTNQDYLETWVALPVGVNPSLAGAYKLEETGQLTPQPVLVVGESALILHRGSGTYVVANKLQPVNFEDATDHWANPNIKLLANKGILAGYADNTFHPDQTVTRAEFTAMLVRALGLTQESGKQSFTDVSSSEWYSKSVEIGLSNQLVHGDEDGSFRPDDSVTREEAAVMFSNAMKLLAARLQAPGATAEAFQDKSDIAGWAQAAVTRVHDYKIMNGYEDQTFRGTTLASRAEVATMLVNLLSQSKLMTK